MSKHLVSFLALTGMVTYFAGAPTAQGFIDFGPGQATGVSADGRSVSGSNGGGAFRWTRAGGIVNLPGAGTAVGISLDGNTLVGDVDSGNAGVWTQATGWVDLMGVPGSGGGCPDLSSGYAINGDGTVAVGLAWDTCADAFGFKWTQAGGMEELPTLGPNSSRANAVSGDGLTIGGWDEAANGSRRAKIWFDDGTQLLPLEGQPNNPEGAGEVWGFSSDGSIAVGGSFEGAFRWTAAGGVEQLGELIPNGGATAYAVSDDGMVIAGSSGNFFTGTTAFVWIEGQGMMSLLDYANDQGAAIPAGTNLSFALDMAPDGKGFVGQGGVFPFSTGFYVITRQTDAFGTIGAAPANVLGLVGVGEGYIGNTLTLTTSNVAPGTGTVLTGFSEKATDVPFLGGSLLVDLGVSSGPKASGFGGAVASTLPAGRLVVSQAAAGTATTNVTIPNNVDMVGKVIYAQSIALDPAQPEGWALSNGLRIVVSGP